jgi:HK97 family phage prohead protease
VTCALKIKSLDPSGSFQGVAACYNSVDLGGDRIEPGAFTRTIAASTVFPLLWQHQSDNPIGTVTVTDSPSGLLVSGQLLMDLDEAKRAYTLIKAKVIKGLSIGFETIQDSSRTGFACSRRFGFGSSASSLSR